MAEEGCMVDAKFFNLDVENLLTVGDFKLENANFEAINIDGSATIKGGITVDTDTFVVSSSNDRVGIALTNPQYTLDVNGDINISPGNTLKIGGVEADFSRWSVNGSDIYRNSNVGIGVSNPQHSLDVDGDINISSGNTLRIGGVEAVFSNWTINGSNIYRNSNVGIGVSNPQNLLHLEGSVAPQVKIAYDQNNHFNINVSSNSDTTFETAQTGVFNFSDNVNANAGLDVSGGALTINNQAITQTNGGNVTFAGPVHITNNTATSSSTTGALKVNGGVGVATDMRVGEDLYVNDDLYVGNDGSGDFYLKQNNAQIKFGANSDTIITHSLNDGLQLNKNLSLKSDGSVLKFGSNEDITLTHNHNNGLILEGGSLTVDGLTLTNNQSVSMSNNRIENVANPTSDQDAATKAYVDATAEGLHVLEACRLATTANISLNNTQTIDGVSAVAGDRILVKDQSTPSQNGVYIVVDGGSWTRAPDFDEPNEIAAGDFVFITEGTINASHGYVMTQTATVTINTTAITWTQFSGAGQIVAGDGLSKNAQELSVDLKANSGLVIDGTELSIDLGASSINGTLAITDGGTGATTLDNLITLGNHTTGDYVSTITAGTGLTSTGAQSGEGTTHSLSVDSSQTQITTVGTLNTLDVTDDITISGTSPNVGLTINNTNSNTSNDPIIRLQSNSFTRYVMGIDRSDSDKFKIGTSSVDTNTRLSIDTSGNVEIAENATIGGTLDVTDDITISGTNPNVGLTINNTNSNTSNDPIIRLQSNSFTRYVMGIDRSDSDKFKIGTSSVDTNTRFSIDTNGNVGIGTNNPVSTLQLKVPSSKDATDASNFDHYGMIISKVGIPSGETTADGTETGICFDIQNGADPVDTRGPGAAITHERTGTWSQGKLHFKTKQSTANDADCVTAMTVAETGNVGIGNTSPDYKLDVNGTINSTTLKTNNIMESYDGSTITYAVTVATKTSAHPYNGSGSTSGYLIDGIESPYIEFVPGKTYRFDQSDSSNSGHPLRFYYEENKNTSYTTDVNTNGTSGSSGAYTEIVVTTSTPRTLFYQCSAHSLMGNQVQVKGGNIDVLSGGTGNTSYTDGQLLIGNSNGNTLSKGTLTAGTGISITNGNGSIEIENTAANTDTTYSTSFVDDNNDAILRLTAGGSGSGNDDLKFVAGSNITLIPSVNGDELTIASTASGSALIVQDEGTDLSTAATRLNFVGSGVTASGTGTDKTITITGGGGGSALTVQDEGTDLSTAATTLNFVGTGVSASGSGSTKTITITGGGGTGGGGSDLIVQDEGVSLSTAATTLNFVGSGVTASGTGTDKTITINASGAGVINISYDTEIVSNNVKPLPSDFSLGTNTYIDHTYVPSYASSQTDLASVIEHIYDNDTSSDLGDYLTLKTTNTSSIGTSISSSPLELIYEPSTNKIITQCLIWNRNNGTDIHPSEVKMYGYNSSTWTLLGSSTITLSEVTSSTISATPIDSEATHNFTFNTDKIAYSKYKLQITGTLDTNYPDRVILGEINFRGYYTPEDGDYLRYDSYNSEWQPKSLGHLKELACEQTIIRTAQQLTHYETWIDLASHNSSYSSSFNTEVTLNVSQNSKVLINLQSGFGGPGNEFICVRLGKKVNGSIVWGSSTGFNTDRNDYLTDPKGDNGYSNKSTVTGDNRIESWDFMFIDFPERLETISSSYIDTDPTNGLTGTHNVTYFMRVRIEHPPNSTTAPTGPIYINRDGDTIPDTNRNQCSTILSATEIGSGAITSFTQEQALAGAGGTAAFTAYGIYLTTYITSEANTTLGTFQTGHGISKLFDNNLNDVGCLVKNDNNFPVSFAIDFNTPQIMTKYRLWPRATSADRDNEAPSSWEIRASESKALYDAGTYTILDSQSGLVETDWDQTIVWTSGGTEAASTNLNKSNEYNLSSIGAYKYYVLYITDNCGSTTSVSLGEWALYGGGFTIPSQVGHSGKVLKTNGTALEWSAPPDALLATPTPENAGQIVAVNAAGDDLEYSGHLKELECEQTIVRTSKLIPGTGTWYDLASHNTVFSDFNTEVTINVSQNSKVLINCSIHVSGENNSFYAIRLGKKVNGNIIWGSVNGNTTTENDSQTDPKGLKNQSSRIEVWSFTRILHDSLAEEQYQSNEMSPHYIDNDPTNGLSGNHIVTYFIRINNLYNYSGSSYIGTVVNTANNTDRPHLPTILSATELGPSAITSFTQEQALAGAGGTAAFTTNVSSSPTDNNYSAAKLYDNNIRDDSDGFIWASVANAFNSSGTGLAWVSYEFNTPQIITKYRLWPRYRTNYEARNQNIRVWELRAATDSSTYDRGNSSTYTVLDSQSLPGSIDTTGAASSWKTSLSSTEISASNSTASNNLHTSNEYNLSKIGAYKYYELYITGNYGNIHAAIAEWALYGGGFTIPSQLGNEGKILKTNGVAVEWSNQTLNNLSDVDTSTTTPRNGQALVWNTEVNKWEPGTLTTTSNTNTSGETTTATIPSVLPFHNLNSNQFLKTVFTTLQVNIDSLNTGSDHQLCGGSLLQNDISAVSASSSYDSNSQVQKLFDNVIGEYNQGWHGGTTSGNDQIQITFNEPKAISKFIMIPRYNAMFQFPKVFSLYGSNTQPSSVSDVSNMTLIFNTDGTGYSQPNVSYSNGISAQDNLNLGTEFVVPEDNRRKYIYYTFAFSENWNTTSDNSIVFTELIIFDNPFDTVTINDLNLNTEVEAQLCGGYAGTNNISSLDASTTHSNADVVHLFNNSITDYMQGWHGLNTGDDQVEIKFNRPIAISKFIMFHRSGYDEQFPKVFSLYGSNTKPSPQFDVSNMDLIFDTDGTGYVSPAYSYSLTTAQDNIDVGIEFIVPKSNRKKYIYYTFKFIDAWSPTHDVVITEMIIFHNPKYINETKNFDIIFNSLSNDTSQSGILFNPPPHTSLNTTLNQTYILDNTTTNDTTTNSELGYYQNKYSSTLISDVPSSPFNINTFTKDGKIHVRLFHDISNSADYDFYTAGTLTIDTSKLMTDYAGFWDFSIYHDQNVKVDINGNVFLFKGYRDTSTSGGSSQTPHFRSFVLTQKFINVKFLHFESGGGETLEMDFYRIKPVAEMEIPDYQITGTFTTPLGGLTNVSNTTPSNGQALVYNSETSQWEPGGGTKLYIKDEGTQLQSPVETLNFVGDSVKVSGDDGNKLITIDSTKTQNQLSTIGGGFGAPEGFIFDNPANTHIRGTPPPTGQSAVFVPTEYQSNCVLNGGTSRLFDNNRLSAQIGHLALNPNTNGNLTASNPFAIDIWIDVSKILTAYSIYPADINQYPKQWDLQAYNNLTNTWTTIDTQSGIIMDPTNNTTVLSSDMTSGYHETILNGSNSILTRGYRFIFYETSGTYIQFGDIKMNFKYPTYFDAITPEESPFLGGMSPNKVSITNQSFSHSSQTSGYSTAALYGNYLYKTGDHANGDSNGSYYVDASSGWTTSSTWFWKFTINESKVVKYVRVWPYTDSSYSGRVWNLYGSTDGGSTFKSIGTQEITSYPTQPTFTTDTNASGNLPLSIRLDFDENVLSYTTYKLEVTSYNQGTVSTNRFGIREIQFGEHKYNTYNQYTRADAISHEEGTFTATFNNIINGTVTSPQTCNYQIIGNYVELFGELVLDASGAGVNMWFEMVLPNTIPEVTTLFTGIWTYNTTNGWTNGGGVIEKVNNTTLRFNLYIDNTSGNAAPATMFIKYYSSDITSPYYQIPSLRANHAYQQRDEINTITVLKGLDYQSPSVDRGH